MCAFLRRAHRPAAQDVRTPNGVPFVPVFCSEVQRLVSSLFGRLRERRMVPLLVTAAIITGTAFSTAPARAHGTVRVQQHDGSTQTYTDVNIRIVKGKAMIVSSADGVGKLIIDNAACSYVGDLLRCLLNGVTLDQHHEKKRLELEQGTLYVNFTDQRINMPLSTQSVKPQGVVLAYRTMRGTFVSLHGTIDELQQQ